jgi:integrase
MPTPWRHPKTGVYWLRVRVPTDVQAQFGTKEAKRSLRTKDPEEAKLRLPTKLQELQAEWQRLREGPVTLTPREISGLVGEHYREAAALGGEAEDGGAWSALEEASKRGSKGPAAAARWWGPTIDVLAAKAGLVPDEDSRLRLAQALYEADLKVAEVNRRAAEGDFSPDPNLARFAPMPQPRKPDAPKVTLADLRELWAREHKAAGGPEATRRAWELVVADFARFLSETERGPLVGDAAAVTAKDVTDYADHLRHDRSLKAKSINGKYLGALRAIFGVGVTKHKIASNPAKGASVSPDKVTKTRPKGFTDEEAKAILKAALGQQDPMRRWVPWIAAYSGCRVGEIGQLRREDFKDEGGIPFFVVTPEAGSVKTGEFRVVPVHPHLVELGLLDFVAEARPGRIFKQKDAQGIVAGFVRTTLGLPEGYTIQPNHAWRHRLKTMGRVSGMDLTVLDVIQGHAPKTEGERYGEWPVAALYREVVKLPRYETA